MKLYRRATAGSDGWSDLEIHLMEVERGASMGINISIFKSLLD